MATRIMSVKSCDECGIEQNPEGATPNEWAPIVTYEITWGTPATDGKSNTGITVQTSVEMDLCEECGEAFTSMYREIWRSINKKRQSKKDAPTGFWTCKQCDFVAANKQGLGNHVARKHS